MIMPMIAIPALRRLANEPKVIRSPLSSAFLIALVMGLLCPLREYSWVVSSLVSLLIINQF